MAEKQTTQHVSQIASRLIDFDLKEFGAPLARDNAEEAAQFCQDVRTLAASCLSQDERKGDEETPVTH